jgi:hypothetical protein
MLYLGVQLFISLKPIQNKREGAINLIEYVITDGHGSYIRHDSYSGKYVPVRNESLAERWEQRSKAQNILKNGLSKQIRKKFHVQDVSDGAGICNVKKDNPDEEEKVTTVADLHIDKVKEIISKDCNDSQIKKWEEGLNSMTEFVMDAEERREELSQAMSEIDKEITDIQHYIEFNDMNAYQGWLAYKMLQNRLKKRRKIKNELQVLTQLGGCKIDSSMLEDITKAIKDMGNRIYTPRVLTELFD